MNLFNLQPNSNLEAKTSVERNERTVIVSHISPSANERTVSEFFSFCGRILDIKFNLNKDSDGEALIVFENEDATKTALLLSNALIAEHPIIVSPYTPEAAESFKNTQSFLSCSEGEEPAFNQAEQDTQQTNKGDNLKPDLESNTLSTTNPNPITTIIANLIANGYVLGVDALVKAKKLDEEKQICAKICAAASVAKEKLQDLDRQYKICDSVTATCNSVSKCMAYRLETLKTNVQEIKKQTEQLIQEKLSQRAADAPVSDIKPPETTQEEVRIEASLD